MQVYLIADIEVSDKALYAQYVEKAQKIVKKYGGKYLSRGANIISISGGWKPQRIVVIKFSSKKQLDECFGSPEYLDIVNLRKKSTFSRSILVEGSLD